MSYSGLTATCCSLFKYLYLQYKNPKVMIYQRIKHTGYRWRGGNLSVITKASVICPTYIESVRRNTVYFNTYKLQHQTCYPHGNLNQQPLQYNAGYRLGYLSVYTIHQRIMSF